MMRGVRCGWVVKGKYDEKKEYKYQREKKKTRKEEVSFMAWERGEEAVRNT